MINFLNCYLIIYFVTFVYIQIFLTQFLNIDYSIKHINYLITYIIKFSKYKNLILALLLTLSGLPPFYLFIVKFNILIFLLHKINIIYIIIIFVIFYLNMLFYVQIFIFKNNNFYLKISNNLLHKNVNKYSFTFSLMLFLTIMFASILFFKDCIFIINLL